MKQHTLRAAIFSNPVYKDYLWMTIIFSIGQIVVFKILYPFPDFISDSYNYIETNLQNLKVNLWPIGYALFLRAVHTISSSHVFLVVVQYLILQITLLYFFFTLLHLYSPSLFVRRLLFCFLFLNPIFLFLSNCVLSDALFCAISLLLFTQYLWMFHQPRISHLILQALLIGAAFSIRYTAMYYPFISIAALLLSRYKLPLKLAGAATPWLLIFPFIWYTQQQTKAVTGTAEFSVFGSWQIANNALYMYPHIQVDTSKLPPETKKVDKVARYYFKHLAPKNPPLTAIEGSYFLKVPDAVLKPYQSMYGAKSKSSLQNWGSVSPVFKTYGSWLVKHYPLAFTRYYLLLNVKNYGLPYLEKFGYYNRGLRKMSWPALVWFNIPDQDVSPVPAHHFQGYIFFLYPLFFLLLNLYFLARFIQYIASGRLKTGNPLFTQTLLLTAAFLFTNFCFSVFATPVVLRYQVLPMLLLFCFSVILTQQMHKKTPASTGVPS